MIEVRCVAPVARSRLPSAVRSVLRRAPSIVNPVFVCEKKSRPSEVQVLIGGRSFMRKLHRQFMSDGSDTDILTFPTDEGGDIAICAPVALENARRFNELPAREFLRLLVHGSLHLLGYRDEPTREHKKMWKKQESLVEALWTR